MTCLIVAIKFDGSYLSSRVVTASFCMLLMLPVTDVSKAVGAQMWYVRDGGSSHFSHGV
jgi:hypothetical protein